MFGKSGHAGQIRIHNAAECRLGARQLRLLNCSSSGQRMKDAAKTDFGYSFVTAAAVSAAAASRKAVKDKH